MSEAWKGGSTRRWRATRAEVMWINRVLYGGRCRARCVGICAGKATQAHHTLGRNVTGDDVRFIEGVCGPCNVHIGDPRTHPADCVKCVNVEWAHTVPVPQPRRMTKW
jgi:hypothetical protein